MVLHFNTHTSVVTTTSKSTLIQYEPQHESVTRPNLGATKRPGLTILSNVNVPAAISVLEAKVADTLTCIMHSNHAQRHCRHYVISPGICPSPARRMRSWSTYQTNLQAACAANPSIMRLLIGPEDYLLADSRSSQLEPSAHSMHPLPSQGRTSYYGHTIPMICRRVGRCATDWCSLMPHPCRLCPPARPPIPPVGSGAHKHQRARGPLSRL